MQFFYGKQQRTHEDRWRAALSRYTHGYIHTVAYPIHGSGMDITQVYP